MRLFIAAFLLSISPIIFAQKNTYNLPALLQRVSQNYPSIKAKEANIHAAGYYLKASRKNYLPDLIVGDQYQYSTDNGLTGSYYSNEGTAISTSGGMKNKNDYQGTFGSFTTLMVDWHAFDFGKVKQSVKLAESQVQLAKADYENEVFQQQIRVTDAYLLLSLSQKLVAVQEANLRRSEAVQQYITSRTQSGLLPGVDSSSALAEVAKARLDLLQSQQLVAQQKNNLEELSGIPADSIHIDTTVFLQKIPNFNIADSSIINNNPSILYSRQELETQINRSQVIKKSALPTINVLGIGWGRGSGIDRATNNYTTKAIDGLPYQTYNYMAGVALKWNITSLAKTKQQYKASQQEIEATQYEIDQQSGILKNHYKNAVLQYAVALEQTKVAPIQYKAALDAYTISEARYKAGLSSLNDVIQSYYVLNRANVDNAISINNVWRALLQHAAATGNLSEFTNQLPQ